MRLKPLLMTSNEFERIFKEQFPVLCNLAASIVKDDDEAKDIVQQVFLKLWQKKDELVIKGPIAAYLYRAVVNTAFNHKLRIKKNIGLDLYPELEKISESDTDTYHKVKVETEVRKAISTLSPMCREVFTMNRFTELSNREIAGEFDISVKAVEKHISKAYRILKEKLKPLITNELLLLLFCFQGVGFLTCSLSIIIIFLS